MQFPRWLSWLFLLFLGYLIFTGNRATPVRPDAPPPSAETPATRQSADFKDYPKLQAFTNGNRWQRALNPDYVGEAKINELQAGTGEPAQCGDTVTLHLRGTLPDGSNFDTEHEDNKPMTLALGNAPYPVLNDALIGMHEGGKRQITAPPQQVYAEGITKTRDDVLLHVTLDKLDAQVLPDHILGLHIYVEAEGEGNVAGCGAPLSLELTLWNKNGSQAYRSTHPVSLKLGKDAVPRELAAGLNGMRPGEIRTLILPPSKEKLSEHLPVEIRAALTQGEVTILTVKRLGVSPEAAAK